MKRTHYHFFLIKIVLALAVFSISISTVFSQRLNEDSIRKVIAQTKNDSVRIVSQRRLGSYLINKGDDSSGLLLLQQAGQQARKINFQPGICEVLLAEGNYYRLKSDWANALSKYKAVTNQSRLIKDSALSRRTRMMAINNLGGIYNINGDYTTALDYYLKSRDILETLNPDATSLSVIYVNIAGMYNALNQTKKAEEYLSKCYVFLDSAKPYLRCIYWLEKQNIADKNKDASLMKLTIDSLENALKSPALTDREKIDYLGTLYQMKGKFESEFAKNYPEAIKNFEQMLRVARELEDPAETNSALYEIGNAYYKNGNNQKAIGFLEQAYNGAMENSIGEIVLRSAKLLAEVLKKENKNERALDYLSVAYQFNDSLKAEKNLSQLNFLEASYQNEKKEKEIAQLKTINTEKELAVVKRNRILVIGGITAVALLIVFGLLFRASRQKQTIAEKDKKIKEEQIKFLERQQQVVSLQSMINGQETERIRIAKDLHDGLGGVFSTVKMHYSTLQHEIPEVKGNELYKKTFDLINNASDELRKVAHNMMPEVLMKVGLIEALKDFCNNINAGKLLKISLQAYGMEKRLGSSTEVMLFRVMQELINNIIKHAYATEAIIQFNREGNRLSITIEDNGRGFNLRDAEEKETMGMNTIKSRVDYLNGRLTIDSRQDIGTTIMIDLLLNEN